MTKRMENTAAAAAIRHSLTPPGEPHRVVIVVLLLDSLAYNLLKFYDGCVCYRQIKTDAGK